MGKVWCIYTRSNTPLHTLTHLVHHHHHRHHQGTGRVRHDQARRLLQ
jgi:hypothetical protein